MGDHFKDKLSENDMTNAVAEHTAKLGSVSEQIPSPKTSISKQSEGPVDISPKELNIQNLPEDSPLRLTDCDLKEITKSTTGEEQVNSLLPEIESSDVISEKESDTEEVVTVKKSKRIAALDSSDSESESVDIMPHDKSFVNSALNEKDTECCTTGLNDDIVPENTVHKSRLTMLCDSDSDDEPNCMEQTQQALNLGEPNVTEERMKTSSKKTKKSHKAPDPNMPKRMTPKEAAEQRKEIQSESQRMVRERNISLPYHKPKSHGIREFLARRPKLSRVAPEIKRAPPSVAIKMSTDQLEEISKKLKEREKELKEFYKSESESDNESVYTPDQNEAKESTEDSEKSPDVDENTKTDIYNNENEECNNQENPKDSQANSDEYIAANQASEIFSSNEAELGHKDSPMEVSNNIPEAGKLEEETLAENNGTINTCPEGTENYDFNLDDTGESTEIPSIDSAEKDEQIPPKFTYTDLDREIENFELEKERPPVKSQLELLKEKLANQKPALSGRPDEIIDLDADVGKSQEVVELMERFAKHAAPKKHQLKHKVKLSIVTVESGGDIHKEEVAMNVDSDDEAPMIEEKPGAKLQKLKEELQMQMELKKTELWQQKAAKGIRAGLEGAEDVVEGEKDILDYDDEEEEAEMTEGEETDEEPEDDIELVDKPSKECAFLDREAEVSDDENETVEPNSTQEKEESEDECNSEGFIEEANSNTSVDSVPKKKVLRRILKPQDDSDEEDLFNDSVLEKSAYNAHLDSTVTADEDEIPPAQRQPLRTPVRSQLSQTKSITDFLTPISFITSIQNLASGSKTIKDDFLMPFKLPSDDPEQEKNSTLQKRLFTSSDDLDSQRSEIQQSLSDREQDNEEAMGEGQSECTDEPPSTQDLLGICSGQFTGVTQLEASDNPTQSQSGEFKCLGQEDMIISQLLDEEELENFKKKFESPVNSTSQRNIFTETEEVAGGGVIDSDEEGEDGVKQRKKKANQKKIQFSDDESSSEECEDTEEINLQDRDDSDVEYDSEENEISSANPGKSEKAKLSEFLDAEAELSESEWGSEDEDEKGLDELEIELGDKEKFDEEQIRTDIERIHMRRLLDDDTREVKILQELLLEDGEMHGTGRQRQFRWKNIDLNDDQANEKKDDDDIYLDEEESEEQWRKKRHEREMFLKKQQQKSQNMEGEDDLLCNSQILKIGQKFLERSVSYSSQNEKDTNEVEDPFKCSPFALENKRGSFLNRSDQVLQRVAEYTKVTAAVNVDNSKKTTKHFLFQSVSMAEESIISGKNKRKASEATPKVLKKLRLNTNLSPAVEKKGNKSDRSKKLFNF